MQSLAGPVDVSEAAATGEAGSTYIHPLHVTLLSNGHLRSLGIIGVGERGGEGAQEAGGRSEGEGEGESAGAVRERAQGGRDEVGRWPLGTISMGCRTAVLSLPQVAKVGMLAGGG